MVMEHPMDMPAPHGEGGPYDEYGKPEEKIFICLILTIPILFYRP